MIIRCLPARLVNGCDGILVATPDCFEPTEVLDAFQAWFAETSRKVYTVGPMLPPPGENAASNEKKQSASSGEIDKFMEQTLKTHGKQSLIYVSFPVLREVLRRELME